MVHVASIALTGKYLIMLAIGTALEACCICEVLSRKVVLFRLLPQPS